MRKSILILAAACAMFGPGAVQAADPMTVYHDGRDFRFHAEDQEFDSSGDETTYSPATITEGKMVLKPLPASLTRALPPLGTFPKAAPHKAETH